jgi:hypothetical protein
MAKAPSSRSTTSEPVHDFLRRARARAGREAAEIDEHDGNAADVAVGLGALGHQALDHLR